MRSGIASPMFSPLAGSGCPVCHGFGGTLATVDDVKADTPKEVVQAVQDAAPWPAFIKCPECDGSGLLYR